MSTKKLLANLKKGKAFRDGYTAALINVQVPLQVRALRKRRGWDQAKLAQEAGMAQPQISLIERPSDRNLNIATLLRIASALDVGLIVRFAPFSELMWWSEGFSPDTFNVRDFETELPQLESEVFVTENQSTNLAFLTVATVGIDVSKQRAEFLDIDQGFSLKITDIPNKLTALGDRDGQYARSLRKITGYTRSRIPPGLHQYS